MTFLHNETSGIIKRLSYVGNKGTYADTGNTYTGHKKALGVDDRIFSVSNTIGEAYKWTIKRTVSEGIADIKASDKVDIGGIIYIVKAVKPYIGITFATTKVLITK